MKQDWKSVWDARQLEPGQGSLLAQLMAADGLDTSFGKVSESKWRDYVNYTLRQFDASPPASVFEVGCGAGAYLYPLHEAGFKVAGLDYSSALLSCARTALPGADLHMAEACKLDTATRYDYVVSSGVFIYFPSVDYSARVLDLMLSKATKGIAVLDVPDRATRDACMADRRASFPPGEYASRYQGLEHLFFERDWFINRLQAAGAQDIKVVDQAIEGYANSAFRFNVFARMDEKT